MAGRPEGHAARSWTDERRAVRRADVAIFEALCPPPIFGHGLVEGPAMTSSALSGQAPG